MSTTALPGIIRSGETTKLISMIQMNQKSGMITMDDCLNNLLQDQKIDSLVVVWPNGQREVFGEMAVNENRELIIGRAEVFQYKEQVSEAYFKPLNIAQFTWTHKENTFDDFKREILIPHQMSSFGPALEYGESLDGNMKYIFLGGAKDQQSQVLTIDALGNKKVQVLEDIHHESNAALFIDADKGSYKNYLDLCLERLSDNGIIVVDNVLVCF